MSTYSSLKSSGLVNELFDYSDLVNNHGRVDRRTYCSSHSCAYRSHSKLGKLVHHGSHLETCPDCGSSNFLAYRETNVD